MHSLIPIHQLLKLIFLNFFMLISLQGAAHAQSKFKDTEYDSSAITRFVLNDESNFIGKVLKKTNESIIISTSEVPQFEVPYSSIKRIERIDDGKPQADSSSWFPNPNPSRYLFTNSGFNLNKGSGYYQNTYLLLNAFNVGVTDYFSIGGGFELISTFSREIPMIYFFTPKVAFPITEKLRIGAGALVARADQFSIGLTYGLLTYGNSDDNLTTGLGWGFVEGEFTPQPTLTFSGMKRLRRKLSLVTENWFFFTENGRYDPILSYGIRFFGESFATDFGLLNNPEVREVFPIGIPYVGFMVTF